MVETWTLPYVLTAKVTNVLSVATRKKVFIIIGAILLITVFVVMVVYFSSSSSKAKKAKYIYRSAPYVGGVVTNGYGCAEIGNSILLKGGTAVDAAIAALLCDGVSGPAAMGVGGGFLMTIYIREHKIVQTLIARETAPSGATEDMFHGDPNLASKGGLAVAVPGELRGYWYAHRKYGKLPWADLLRPTIDLCKKGNLVTKYLAKVIKRQEHQIRKDPGLREIFINPKTDDIYREGDHVKREKLAATLEAIAKYGADALYDGILTKSFVEDIQKVKGIITVEDMKQYRPVWIEPISAKLPNNETLYTAPLPGSGVIMTFIMNILSGFLDHSNINTVKNWQRIVESFKYGYGKRTELGDPAFVEIEPLLKKLTSAVYAKLIRNNISDRRTYQDHKHYGANVNLVEDHGTAHISVLAPNGDAVSVTSTINQYFGAGFRSLSTGIILNDEMDDFSAPNITNNFGIPPSPANFIRPGKRPVSSMCPSIIVDQNGDVVLVIGAAGGTKITTTTALVTMRYLWFRESLSDAVSHSRLHHQLFPMQINFEHDFNKELVNGLKALGHVVHVGGANHGFAALTAIAKRNGTVEGSIDQRRTGQVVLIRKL